MTQAWDPRTAGMAPAHPHTAQPVPGGGFAPPAYPQQGYAPPQAAMPAEMPDLTEEVSLNDDLEFEALSPLPEQAVNESARFCFLMFDDAGDIRLRAGRMFYGRIGEKRFPFLAPPDSHPLFARCVDKWDMPKKRLGAIVLAYNVDKEGNFIPGETFKYRLHALLFNDVQASWFRSQNKRRSFRTHDLMRTGTKATQFGVEYSYSVEDECVFATLPADKQADILAKALLLHQKYLGPRIGRPRPDEEIMDLLRDVDPLLRRQGSQGAPQAPVNPWGGSPVPFNGYPQQPQQPQMAHPGYPQHAQLPPPGQFAPQPQFAPQGGNMDFAAKMAAASHQMPNQQDTAPTPPPTQ